MNIGEEINSDPLLEVLWKNGPSANSADSFRNQATYSHLNLTERAVEQDLLMFGELIPLGGGDPIPLIKQKLLIGRRPSCDICLPFPNVSSQHCELVMENGYWKVLDLGSSNGLKVNGLRQESKFLLPGDELTLAKHTYEIRYEPLSDAPPPEDDDPFKLSLMEKAGLVNHRRKRKAKSSHSEDLMGDVLPKNVKSQKKRPGNQQEDQIMQWLSDDDEQPRK